MEKWFLIYLGLLLHAFGMAQSKGDADTINNELSVAFQLRPRVEYRNGALFPKSDDSEANGIINNRARLSTQYRHNKLSFGLSVQHVGLWGKDASIYKDDHFTLNEAWVNMVFGNGFFAKLGRQTLVYDNERLLSAIDWNISGRFHNALKLGYETSTNQLHLIAAFDYASGDKPYKNLQTAWYHHIVNKEFSLSFIAINIGRKAGNAGETRLTTRYLQTAGTNFLYKPGNVSVYGTLYYQTGYTVTNRKVSAFMWALNANYQINPAWKLLIATDYLSGNKANSHAGSTKSNAFDPLYGSHHKYYGTMDYFYASPFINGLAPGLWDNQAGVTFNPSSNVSLLFNYHYFLTATDVYVKNKKQPKALGSEIDLQVNWDILKDISLSAGYSTMLGTNTMKAVKGGNPSRWQDWVWLSVNINPKVFISKW
ncbi:MAG: alginate export family protein [Tannerellaceae bacterium]|jgi:hypothetical protein|nr:alginate export family protein [Tannerellaceae bacterium]